MRMLIVQIILETTITASDKNFNRNLFNAPNGDAHENHAITADINKNDNNTRTFSFENNDNCCSHNGSYNIQSNDNTFNNGTNSSFKNCTALHRSPLSPSVCVCVGVCVCVWTCAPVAAMPILCTMVKKFRLSKVTPARRKNTRSILFALLTVILARTSLPTNVQTFLDFEERQCQKLVKAWIILVRKTVTISVFAMTALERRAPKADREAEDFKTLFWKRLPSVSLLSGKQGRKCETETKTQQS